MSSVVERIDSSPLLDYQRILEMPRPFTQAVSLSLNGDALLVDEEMVLAFIKDPQDLNLNQLFITRHKSVIITLIKEDGSFRSFGFINPDVIQEPFVTLRLGFRPSRPYILISDAYKAVFQEDSETELKFNLESRHPIEVLPVSGSVNHSKLLEDISRKNQPRWS